MSILQCSCASSAHRNILLPLGIARSVAFAVLHDKHKKCFTRWLEGLNDN